MRPLPAVEARVTRLRSPTFGDTRAVALAPLYYDFRESPHMGVMRLGRTHDATLLGPGTLYGILARLEKEGMIQSLPSKDRRRP